MKLKFRNEEEFKEFIYGFMLDMLDYIGKDEDKFQNFCTAFYSVIYCRNLNELFEKNATLIKKAMNKPMGQFILAMCREKCKDLKEIKDVLEGDSNERFKDNAQ